MKTLIFVFWRFLPRRPWPLNDPCTHLHMTSCVSSTRHISGFLSWPSYMIACSRKKEFWRYSKLLVWTSNAKQQMMVWKIVTKAELVGKSPILNYDAACLRTLYILWTRSCICFKHLLCNSQTRSMDLCVPYRALYEISFIYVIPTNALMKSRYNL
jgi:hypothetical protein